MMLRHTLHVHCLSCLNKTTSNTRKLDFITYAAGKEFYVFLCVCWHSAVESVETVRTYCYKTTIVYRLGSVICCVERDMFCCDKYGIL